jgi:hypothetical protein
VQERLLLLCGAIPRTTLNAVLCHWVHHLLYQSFYKYIIKVCTLKNCWWGGIAESGLQKMHPKPPPKNHLHNSWDSMLSTSTRPKCYPPEFQNWPNFSPRMTSACLYPQLHDFLIWCLIELINNQKSSTSLQY